MIVNNYLKDFVNLTFNFKASPKMNIDLISINRGRYQFAVRTIKYSQSKYWMKLIEVRITGTGFNLVRRYRGADLLSA